MGKGCFQQTCSIFEILNGFKTVNFQTLSCKQGAKNYLIGAG